MTGLIGVVTVGLFIYTGYLLGGRKLAIILGILSAASPQLVIRSLILGQHTFVATFSILLIMFFVLLWKKKKIKFAFLMGLSLGIALSMHYQALNLFVFFPAILFVFTIAVKERIKSVFLMLIGFFIPSLPLLYWDYFQGFSNLNNLLDYFLIGQYRIYVPNSWTIYLTESFPNYWAFVVGRYEIVGIILMALVFIVFVYKSFIKRNISKPLLSLGIIFFILFFVGRFYKGERSEGYLLYFLPFILIFSAWIIGEIKNIRLYKSFVSNYLVILILLCLVGFNLNRIVISLAAKSPVQFIDKNIQLVIEKIPNSKFKLYDYSYMAYSTSMALSFRLDSKNLLDENGIPIGAACTWQNCPKLNYPLVAKIYDVSIYDLRGVDFEKEKSWKPINSSDIYEDLIGWSKKNKLTSSFSLKNYIISKIGNL